MVHRAEWNPAASSYRAKPKNVTTFPFQSRRTAAEYSKKMHLLIKKHNSHTSLFRSVHTWIYDIYLYISKVRKPLCHTIFVILKPTLKLYIRNTSNIKIWKLKKKRHKTRKSKWRKEVYKWGLTFSGKDLVIALWAIGSIHNRWIISLIITSSFVTLLIPGTYLSPEWTKRRRMASITSIKQILTLHHDNGIVGMFHCISLHLSETCPKCLSKNVS